MASMLKIDLFKDLKNEYASPRSPVLVEIGKASYLAVDGRGEPGGKEFQTKIGALYGMAYTVKMTRKFEGRQDYVVGKLEAQGWSDEGGDFSRVPKSKWRWKLMIRTPDFVGTSEVRRAAETLKKRGKGDSVDEVAMEKLEEGECVQMLHVGPYEREGDTVAAMKKFAESKGRTFHGRHHEIYLSDPRRVAPEKLKTILRMPVKC
ncbi:MAG: GyrI-like domain-containing protein [Planctomycetes bacterium]|nr:GyrI-like domain-containing protein [Planctomycetota bacterium]